MQVGPEAPVAAAEGVRDGGAQHRVHVGLREEGDRVEEGEVVDHPHAEAATNIITEPILLLSAFMEIMSLLVEGKRGGKLKSWDLIYLENIGPAQGIVQLIYYTPSLGSWVWCRTGGTRYIGVYLVSQPNCP